MDNKSYFDLEGIAFMKNNNVIINKAGSMVKNLDELPFASRDTLPLVQAIGGDPYLISGRGCYGTCSFCSIQSFYKQCIGDKYRYRSAENVVDEIEYLINKFKIKRCRIFDDNIFNGKETGNKRAYKIADEILQRDLKIKYDIVCRANDVNIDLFRYMKKSGLSRVVIGLESFNDRCLKYYGKNISSDVNYRAIRILDELGIECVGSYIMFNPYSTFQEIKVDLDYFYSRLDIDKGINLINCLLSTSTVLSIDEGTNLYNSNNNQIIKDKYRIKDIRVDKLKKIAVYLTNLLKDNLIELVRIEKYFRLYFKNNVTKEIRKEIDNFWYELAALNLSTFKYYFDILNKYKTVNECPIDLLMKGIEDMVEEINQHYSNLIIFNKKNGIKQDVLPRIYFYNYISDGKIYIYDPAQCEVFEVNSRMIHSMNLYNRVLCFDDVTNEDCLEFDKNLIEKDFNWINKKVKQKNFKNKKLNNKYKNVNMAKKMVLYIMKNDN